MRQRETKPPRDVAPRLARLHSRAARHTIPVLAGDVAMMRRRTVGLVVCLMLGAGAGRAQNFTSDPVDVEAARREGSLSWYTSTPVDLAQQLIEAFQKETGIKVRLLRTGGQAVLRRILPEIAAGQPGADVITMSDG